MTKDRRVLFLDRKIRVKSLEKYADVVYTTTVTEAINNLKSQTFNEVWFTAKSEVPNELLSQLKLILDDVTTVPQKCVVVTADSDIFDTVKNELSHIYEVENVFFRPDDIY